MRPSHMPRVLLLVATVLVTAPVGAQEQQHLRVPIAPSSPTISRVAARGDLVYFWESSSTGDGSGSIGWAYR